MHIIFFHNGQQEPWTVSKNNLSAKTIFKTECHIHYAEVYVCWRNQNTSTKVQYVQELLHKGISKFPFQITWHCTPVKNQLKLKYLYKCSLKVYTQTFQWSFMCIALKYNMNQGLYARDFIWNLKLNNRCTN